MQNPAHKPQTKSGTCACHSPSSDYTIFSGLLFARPNFLFAEARGAPSIHWHSACILHTHIYYIVYWLVGGTGRAEQQNRLLCTPTISLLAVRPRTIFLGGRGVCALDARPCRALHHHHHHYHQAGRQAGAALLHIMLRVSSSGIDRAEHHNTCTAHSLWLRRGKSWKISRNTLLARTRFICIEVWSAAAQGCTHLNEKWGHRLIGVCQGCWQHLTLFVLNSGENPSHSMELLMYILCSYSWVGHFIQPLIF
jgi:hypothetical protein